MKWGRICGLVLFLPHGYEGQGPEHSSARLERYLQLCAEHNMQVCVPTTPAQIFHLLRRQMMRPFRKPLIVMTPKSLLRHKEAVSPLDELANGQFQTVIAEVRQARSRRRCRRVIVCSRQGLLRAAALPPASSKHRRRRDHPRSSSSIRSRTRSSRREIATYPNATEVVWCQEEPQNQGAWYRLSTTCAPTSTTKQMLAYAGPPGLGVAGRRLRARSTTREQKQLIEDAFADKLKSGEMVLAR